MSNDPRKPLLGPILNGQQLYAAFSLKPNDYGVDLFVESQTGRSSTSPARNEDYLDALKLHLQRLADLDAILVSVELASRRPKNAVGESDRRINFNQDGDPVLLSGVTDFDALRLSITRGAAGTERNPNAKPGGGNVTKRLRLVVHFDAAQSPSIDEVGNFLLTGRHTFDLAADSPPSGGRGRHQGYGDATRNRVVEEWAMSRAIAYFEDRDYECENTSHSKPYDLIIAKDNERLTVEVKGTTGLGRGVFLTRNEVKHARENVGGHILFVLSMIELSGDRENPRAGGGVETIINPWEISDADLSPTQYEYALPES